MTKQIIGVPMERRAPIKANSYNPETRSFEAVISTGAGVERRDFDGNFIETLDLNQKWPSSVPLLDTHNARSVNGVLGRVSGIRAEGGTVIASIKLSSRPDAQALGRDIMEGIIDSLSVGYEVSKWRESTVQGVRHKCAAEWRLLETSLVAIPADGAAKIRSGEMAETETEEKTRTRAASRRSLESMARDAGLEDSYIDECEERGLSEREARALAFEQLKARSAATAKVSNTRHNDVTMDNPAARRDAMVEGFSSRMLGATPSEPAAAMIQSGVRSFADAARVILEGAGVRTLGLTPMGMVERAYNTTSDFPELLTSVGNRTLAARFQELLSPIVKLARRKNAQDFRSFSELRLGTNMRLDPVGEHGEMKAGGFVESKEAMKIASYGKTFALSFQAIANDDLGAFSQVTGDLAAAAAYTASDLVISLILANGKLGDGKAVFHADHGNLLTASSALSDTSLKAAVLAMRKQKGIAGEMIAVNPTHLAVAPEAEYTARKLLAAVAATEVDKVNAFANAFTLIVEPRFSDANAWYLIDPALGDLVDSYLSGMEGPQVESKPGWNTLGTEWRVHMHYGTAFMGFRGWHKATGAQ